MIPTFALIFRGRGEYGFGDVFGMIAWGFFTALQLNNHYHTPDLSWFAGDWLVVAGLFTLGARPAWSEDCWPAWGSSDPIVRDKATLASMIRALWFVPLIAYVCWRGGHYFAVLPLAIAMAAGFALCIRWCESVRLYFGFKEQWVTGEVMLGAWLGFIQYIGGM